MKSGRVRTLAWALPLAALLFAGQSWLTYRFFTSRFPGGNDLVARWAPGCALFWHGENPYSDEATLRSQMLIFGRPAGPDEDQAPFFYPLYALWPIAPLCLTHNFPLALAFWMSAMLVALVGGTLLLMRVAGWRPGRWLLALTVVWTALNYPHLRALLLGQPSTLVFGALALTFWLLRRRSNRSDWAAGACLALATIKPQLSFLIIPWLLWWAAWARRWRVWGGLAAALALLLGSSLLAVPTWPADFLWQARHYEQLFPAAYGSLSAVLAGLLGLPAAGEWALTGAAGLTLLALVWRGRRAGEELFVWTGGMVLLLGLFIAPQVATSGYSLLLLPLFYLFSQWARNPRGALWVVLAELGLLVGQWALFLTTLEGNLETPPVFVPFPLLLLAGMLVWRPKAAGEQRSDV